MGGEVKEGIQSRESSRTVEKGLYELSTGQTFSEEPRCAEGRCSVYPLSLSAGMGSGPFNLVSDNHCRDEDPVGGSLHDARDWIHTANGQ